MIRKFFATSISVVLFIEWILCFHNFSLVSSDYIHLSDLKILVIIFFFLLLYLIEKDNKFLETTVLKKYIDKLLLTILLFAIINCFVCYYYRGQDFFETFQHWSMFFLLFFYYPFRLMIFKIKDWERVLHYLLIILLVVEIIMMIFPEFLLFEMTSGNEKFERENRIRIYGDGALVLGNILCFNKALIEKKNIIYWLLFAFSFLCIFLSGFRTVIAACLLIYVYMLLKLRMLKIKYGILSVVVIFVMSFVPAVQERVNEMIERNEDATYDNDKYVRVVSVAYYYNEYFKSRYELFFGSGMVQRIVKNSSTEMGGNYEYKSKYSKDVSYMSIKYHFYPVDWGLIGLSWEAGIPVVLIIYGLTFYLMFKKTPKQYYYISAWALLQLLISFNNPLMYHFHNMIFYALVLVIFEKVLYLEKNKIEVQKC